MKQSKIYEGIDLFTETYAQKHVKSIIIDVILVLSVISLKENKFFQSLLF